eukprot:356875-Chlamydomonas_euryale.AAC.2
MAIRARMDNPGSRRRRHARSAADPRRPRRVHANASDRERRENAGRFSPPGGSGKGPAISARTNPPGGTAVGAAGHRPLTCHQADGAAGS